MALIQEIKNDFSFGQISSKLRGRYDLDIYKQGLAKMKNCFVTAQSSIVNKTFGLKQEGMITSPKSSYEEIGDFMFYLKDKNFANQDDMVSIYETINKSTGEIRVNVTHNVKQGNGSFVVRSHNYATVGSRVIKFVEAEDNHIFVVTKEKQNGSYINAIKLVYSNSIPASYTWDGSFTNIKKLFVFDIKDNQGNIITKINKGPTDVKNLFFDELSIIDPDVTQSELDVIKLMNNIIYKQNPKTKELYISFFKLPPLQNDFIKVKYKGTFKDFNGNERPMTVEEAKLYFPDVYSPDLDFVENDLDKIFFPLEKNEIVQTHVAVQRVPPEKHSKKVDVIAEAGELKQETTSSMKYIGSPTGGIHWLQNGEEKEKVSIYLVDTPLNTITTDKSESFISMADKYNTFTLIPIIKHVKPEVLASERNHQFNFFNFPETTIPSALASNSAKAGKFYRDDNVNFRYSSDYSTQKVGNKLMLYDESKINDEDHKIDGKTPVFVKPKYSVVTEDRKSIELKNLYYFIKRNLNEIFLQGGIGRLDEDKLKADFNNGNGSITELRYILTKMTDVHTEKVNKTTGEIEITWSRINSKLVWFKKFLNVDDARNVDFADNRLILENIGNYTSKMVASSYGNNYDFTYLTLDDFDPFSFKLIASKDTEVTGIFKKNNVYIMTNKGVYGALALGSQGNVMKSNFELITAVRPALEIEPIIINDALIFISKNKRKIFLVTTNDQGTKFKTVEVTSTNDEMFSEITSLEVVDFNFDSGFSVYCVLGKDYVDRDKNTAALIRTEVDRKVNSFAEIDFNGIPRVFEKLVTFNGISYSLDCLSGNVNEIETVTAKEAVVSLLPPSRETHNKLPAFFNDHFNSSKCSIYLGGDYDVEVVPVNHADTGYTGGLRKRFEDLNLDSESKEYHYGDSSVVQFPINFSNFNEGYNIIFRSGDTYEDEEGVTKVKDRVIDLYAIISYYDTY